MAIPAECIGWSKFGSAGEITSPEKGVAGVISGSPTYVAAQFGNGVLIDADGERLKFTDNGAWGGSEGAIGIHIKPVGWSITDGQASSTPTGTHNIVLFGLADVGDNFLYFGFHETLDLIWQIKSGGFWQNPINNISPVDMDLGDGVLGHLLLVWNETGIEGGSDTRRLYLNGSQIWSTTNALTMPVWAGAGYHNIGSYGAGSVWPFDGVLDNPKVWDDSDVAIANVTGGGYLIEGFADRYRKQQTPNTDWW
jgi:hypothetical protein